MSRISAFRLSIMSIAALFMTHAAITITPASHDFGERPVGRDGEPPSEKIFRISLPRSASSDPTARVWIDGHDRDDFVLTTRDSIRADARSGCTLSSQTAVCNAEVEFRPRSVGPKVAVLLALDKFAALAKAQLKGTGTAPVCVHRVVPCNFGPMWTGVFSWKTVLTARGGSEDTENVDVRVTRGVATCTGFATTKSEGRTRTGSIAGTGLFAVEFLPDRTYPWVYRITAACPTPHWPATGDPSGSGENFEPETPSRPADLSHEYNSEKQPATRTAMTLDKLLSTLSKLEGGFSVQHPGADADNGVTGTVTISWKLSWYPTEVAPGLR